MVSLWDMVTFFSAGTALGGTLHAARRAGGGADRYAIAIIAGVVVGAGCVISIRALCRLIVGDAQTPSQARLRMAILVPFVGLVVANCLGFWVATLVVGLIRA